jgi:dTDP-glucose pyrophosphorylase
LQQALQILDDGGRQICLIVDRANRLLGVMTDGDFRRLFLVGANMQEPVSAHLTENFVSVLAHTPKDKIRAAFKESKVHQIPLLTNTGEVVGLATIDDLLEITPRQNQTVILAGGRGTRLGAITKSIPKPMVNVGGRPILELVIKRLRSCGLTRITLCVGYLSEQIQDHFGDGSEFGVEIDYVNEDEPRGTAGPLAHLQYSPDHAFLVMNADLVTELDFGEVLDFHVNSNADLTIVTRPHEVNIPFGVIQEVDGEISDLVEKPSYSFDVSSGIYALSPAVLHKVPRDVKFDMPDLIRSSISAGLRVKSFQFSDYWIDIGRLDELERARRDWEEIPLS